MISAIVTAFVSFASTNIDDIFVLMVFFSQVGDQIRKHHIVIGQYLGISTLLFLSILGSLGLNLVPHQYTGLLGIIPILLGIKEWLNYKKEKRTAENSYNEAVSAKNTIKAANDKLDQATIQERIHAKLSKLIHPSILSVALVTVANGADNIGVYIPLFTRLNILELVVTIMIFILLIAAWCFIGERLTNFPGIKHTIQKYKYILVPIVFISIGIFILIESDLFSILVTKG